MDSPKLIQETAGRDVKLKCGIRNNHTEYLVTSNVQWYFKYCGVGFNKTACLDDNELNPVSWKPLMCEGSPCKKLTLQVSNTTEKDSGLYRCSIQPYRPNDKTVFYIQVVRTFYLEIIGSYSYFLLIKTNINKIIFRSSHLSTRLGNRTIQYNSIG